MKRNPFTQTKRDFGSGVISLQRQASAGNAGRDERMRDYFWNKKGLKKKSVAFMVSLVVFSKNILNWRINSKDKYLENTYFVVAYNTDIFSSSASFTFVKKITVS